MTDLEEIPDDDAIPLGEPDYWTEDDQYPLRDWQEAVTQDYTRMGYWQWVDVQRAIADYPDLTS